MIGLEFKDSLLLSRIKAMREHELAKMDGKFYVPDACKTPLEAKL